MPEPTTVTVPAWVLLYACRYAIGRDTAAFSETAAVALANIDALKPYARTLCDDVEDLMRRPYPLPGLCSWLNLSKQLTEQP